jgi:hypothetical protein
MIYVRFRHSGNIEVWRGFSVGITDERDLETMPLRWPRCRDIHTKFHEDRTGVQKFLRGV